jgi:hypothetical protein
MSKIVFYVHKTDEAIRKSMDMLKNLKYFADHEAADADDEDDDLHDEEDESVDAAQAEIEEDGDGDDNTESDDDDDDVEVEHLGEQILSFWNHRRQKLLTPLSLAGWFCSPDAEIRKDVVENGSGSNRLDIELAIGKLYFPTEDAELGEIIQLFWSEFDDFQTKTGPSYSRPWIWESSEIKKGNDHVWHKLYSIPYTKVFGKVACRVCSKPLGCGQAERNWGALKHLKTGKRSHISGDKAQKQATVYGAACIDKARAALAIEEANGLVVETRWTDADLAFELGLENWEVGNGNVPVPLVPKRIFRAWIEDWEWDLIMVNDCLAEAKLLQKYQGLMWIDQDSPDEDMELCVALENKMEFQGGRHADGWCLICTRPDGSQDPWTLHCVVDEIGEYEQPAELNVEVIFNEEMRAANNVRLDEEEEERKESRKKKPSYKKTKRRKG